MIETVDAFITILAYLITFYPVRLGSNNCLALLRPVAVGDIGHLHYRWLLEEFSSRKNDILELTMCDGKLETGRKKLEATRQGSRVLLVFRLCRLRTDRCSSLLSC